MRRLTVFNQVSVDGYFVDRRGDMSWAKEDRDAEFDAFTSENASLDAVLLFGRVTYDLMASFWPTPMAAQNMPTVAERMNSLPKLVFSRGLKSASWNNTTIVNRDPAAEVRRLKSEPGPDLVIMGSGNVVSQLACDITLIDEYQLVVIPIALGGGRTLFDGLAESVKFQLMGSRTFGNGNVLLRYEPKGP